MFSDEEMKTAQQQVEERTGVHLPPGVVRVAMEVAVELAAARGGTMTADELNIASTYIPGLNSSLREMTSRMMDHISAIGARNAVLEDVLMQALTVKDGLFDEVKSVTKDRDWWRACSEIERKRGDAAEESSRELMRRAQQVDKTAGHDNCPDNPCPAHFPYCEGVNKETPQRWPCSPTCTHDDASTPGHPERVAEASRRFMDGLLAGYSDAKEAERVKERSEAVYRVVADPALSVTEAAAYEHGAEVMRAACWEAVQEYLNVIGCSDSAELRRALKAAIEGVVP